MRDVKQLFEADEMKNRLGSNWQFYKPYLERGVVGWGPSPWTVAHFDCQQADNKLTKYDFHGYDFFIWSKLRDERRLGNRVLLVNEKMRNDNFLVQRKSNFGETWYNT